METKDYFEYIVKNMHTTVMATVDDKGKPVTSAVDIMDYTDNSLIFLTAKGKNMYERIVNEGYVSFTAIKGEDTLSSVAVSVRGYVRNIGSHYLKTIFEKNKYMAKIYPTIESSNALTVFEIYKGSGEYFDLSKHPIERASFVFGGEKENISGYYINDNCNGCGKCLKRCPQNAISILKGKANMNQNNCLHCGGCFDVCSNNAIIKR